MSWILHRLKGDKVIWIIAFLLGLISILAIYSSTSAMAYRLAGGDTETYVLRHIILIVLGLVVMFVVHKLDYRIFARLSNILLVVTIPLLLYTIVKGAEVNDAARWINIFGQSFQPSDLAKLTLLIYLAKLLTVRQDVIKDFYEGFLPALFWVSVICGLIAPADLSTAVLMFLASLMVMFIAGVDLKYIGLLVMVAVVGLGILGSTAKRSATWESRMSDYVNRILDPEYRPIAQTTQSHIAFAGAGLFGKGAGKSAQRNFIPHANADFIFAVIVEEYGLVGAAVVICLYLILLFRSVSIITMSKTFGALLASGLAFILVLQAMMNMGVTVGLLPVTGLPLPLISWGGTSILITSISLGIILSVSREAFEGSPEKKKVTSSTSIKRKIQTRWANA
ncbi:MAG: putative lipid II flippase FtsW [Bacteroidia bacterium]|nr:putative lipid II flippase FtsW [Bacteroidia bacterium]